MSTNEQKSRSRSPHTRAKSDSKPIIVNSWNEWDPLKHVIVGVPDESSVPALEPAFEAKAVGAKVDLGKVVFGPREAEAVKIAREQLDSLCNVLRSHGVTVDRPTPLPVMTGVTTPYFSAKTLFGCMPARDLLLTIGNTIVESPGSWRCRYWETMCYRDLLHGYWMADRQMKWMAAPKPKLTDESYSAWWALGTDDERAAWVKEDPPKFASNEHEILFDAADTIRLGRDLFVQHGCTTNLKGVEWIRRQFPDHRVHTLNFPSDPWPMHIDATLVPLKPGLALINPERPLPKDQAALFTEHGWELIEAAPAAHKHPPPGCGSSVWLSMNVLSLDENKVLVEASEIHQQKQMEELGLEAIPVKLRDAYICGGGLHCATADVHRVGKLQNYFADMEDVEPSPVSE
jgi:glycine amidinotransferase